MGLMPKTQPRRYCKIRESSGLRKCTRIAVVSRGFTLGQPVKLSLDNFRPICIIGEDFPAWAKGMEVRHPLQL